MIGYVDYLSIMNSPQQMTDGERPTACVLHLMLKEGPVETKPEESERMLDELEERATKLGPVLEGILLESYGKLHWGINE